VDGTIFPLAFKPSDTGEDIGTRKVVIVFIPSSDVMMG
jgi:hypothetical protein